MYEYDIQFLNDLESDMGVIYICVYDSPKYIDLRYILLRALQVSQGITQTLFIRIPINIVKAFIRAGTSQSSSTGTIQNQEFIINTIYSSTYNKYTTLKIKINQY